MVAEHIESRDRIGIEPAATLNSPTAADEVDISRGALELAVGRPGRGSQGAVEKGPAR
jgi:hypothetical protein